MGATAAKADHHQDEPTAPGPAPFAAAPVAAIAAALAAILTALSPRYGFHRDELYFLAAGHHPAWGYTDQPPLTPLIARAATTLFGESPAGLRTAATLFVAAAVVTVAAIARELHAGRQAQILAALTAATSGFVVGIGHLLSTATFDLLAWLVITLLVLRLLRTGDTRWWLAIGAAAGIAVENKYLIVLLLASLLPALALQGPRRLLRSPHFLAGIALAAALALPNLIWQATHSWPQFSVAGGISDDDGMENRALFFPDQLLYLSPLYVPIWAAGWLHLRRTPALRWARSLTIAYPLLCFWVIAAGGKAYYAIPLLLVLLAAGCEPAVRWAHRRLLATAVALTAAMTAVLSLPVLPVSAIGIPQAVNAEVAEEVGWPQLTDAVAQAWSKVPPSTRPRAVILAQNYGQAGALVRYGPSRGLPTPYSGHMSFADWGPPPDSRDGPVILILQRGSTGYEADFTACREITRVDNGHDVDNEEQHAAIMLCTGTTEPWSALWPHLRRLY
ncbi:glycosyltransferase family 39 protein [Streptomyces sp. NPDC050738]|uniref:glycosyltransferase family 39 protein n=1 Tax=Streptomyces sp. NPDC050738 TaxID=3154744 RepID=UPI003425F8C5